MHAGVALPHDIQALCIKYAWTPEMKINFGMFSRSLLHSLSLWMFKYAFVCRGIHYLICLDSVLVRMQGCGRVVILISFKLGVWRKQPSPKHTGAFHKLANFWASLPWAFSIHEYLFQYNGKILNWIMHVWSNRNVQKNENFPVFYRKPLFILLVMSSRATSWLTIKLVHVGARTLPYPLLRSKLHFSSLKSGNIKKACRHKAWLSSLCRWCS